MKLPELVRQVVEKKMGTYCQNKIPPAVQDQIKLQIRIHGTIVTLFERRFIQFKGERWVNYEIAQFRYDFDNNLWTLYCRGRNGRWRIFPDLESDKNFENLLKVVDHDPTGIFWV